jgi:hypothetical protein
MWQKNSMQRTSEYHDDVIAAASSCPALDCGSLVIDCRPADNSRLCYPEDWGFTCSRCGLDFTVPLNQLIFRSVPKQWFSADTDVGSDQLGGSGRNAKSAFGSVCRVKKGLSERRPCPIFADISTGGFQWNAFALIIHRID